MRLAEFIPTNMEAILVDWEAFAATLFPPSAGMSSLALRDHAGQILKAISRDLTTPQSRVAQSEKSKGHAVKVMNAPETAAETHAVLRAKSGMDINQLVAEYRALRASVLRKWQDALPDGKDSLEEVVRFNEAIDQAIAESISFFSDQMDQARNLLLGMVGHDMRSPLSTIQSTATYLSMLNAGPEISVAASRLIRSGASMQALLDDLVDFNRTKLGLGINITPAESDLAGLLADELDQLRGAHPGRAMEFQVTGDTRGCWDGLRLQQLVRNLVLNAIKYGSAEVPIRVAAVGDQAEVRIAVTNGGPPLEGALLDQVFEPLRRGPEQEANGGAEGGLGLGLYIVREIARAHGGEVTVRSGDGQTMFTVRLPRDAQAAVAFGP